MLRIAGGVCAAQGFRAGATSCGIKRSGRPDLSIVLSDAPATAAGVFTTNALPAAPVTIGAGRLTSGARAIRGILTVSGVANAMTGRDGVEDNERILAAAEAEFGLGAGSLLPACTGIIGPRIPVGPTIAGLSALRAGTSTSRADTERAAHAILTTDTRSKEAAVRVRLSGGEVVRIGGMAKGSGMIRPRLAGKHATMLGFVTTDATVSPDALARLLERSAESTFNMVNIDGDTSTNDTVYVLANGAAGAPSADRDPAFAAGLHAVLESLARQIAHDGEGATKLFTVRVRGARSVRDARAAARAVVSSTLVKAALFGADPNVGRIACAIGYSGAEVDPADLSVAIARPRGPVPLIVAGRPATGLDNGGGRRVRDLLRQLDEVPLDVDLHRGRATATAWGCDLSYAYVQINAAYRT